MKSKILTLSLLVAAAFSASAIDITSFGTAITENFDSSLVNTGTGTSSSFPTGWAFSESGTSANTTYTASTGTLTTGDTYSYGVAGAHAVTDRALGGLASGTLIPSFGVQFQNQTGGIITSLVISYYGEQWRLGALSREDHLDFQYSTDATSLNTGTWLDPNNALDLDFTAPRTGPTVGLLDGNLAANRTLISTTINALSIGSGATFWLRWTDIDASGNDDGLAVDDFSLTARGNTPQTSVPDSLPAGFAAGAFLFVLGLGYRFGRQTSKA